MKIDLNAIVRKIGEGALLTCGWFFAHFVPTLLAAIPRG
jgi:hypothetical protein